MAIVCAGVLLRTHTLPPILGHHASTPPLPVHAQTICHRRTSSPQMLDGFAAVGSVVGTAAALIFLAAASAVALWVSQEADVAELRAKRMQSETKKTKGVMVNSRAYVRPRELWREEELKPFDGSQSPDGPILLAAEGLVFNVSPARKFYGPGGEYSIMAGRDASRFLGKNTAEEETEEERALPLNVAERASLSAWTFSFKSKYDIVGRLATAEEAARMLVAEARTTAYMDQLEQMSQQLDVDAQSEHRAA